MIVRSSSAEPELLALIPVDMRFEPLQDSKGDWTGQQYSAAQNDGGYVAVPAPQKRMQMEMPAVSGDR
jgi:hypothetical protein